VKSTPFPLRRYLSARLAPVVLLLLAVVTVSAPIAYLVMGSRSVRAQAAASAEHVAEALRGEIQEQPLLWRYNTLKILPHLRAHTAQASINRIEVTDSRGVPIDLGFSEEQPSDEALIWAAHPVHIGAGDRPAAAEVWVGATVSEVQQEAFLLLLTFSLLGAGLAGLTYWLPVRAMGAAERRIGGLVGRLHESQQALESLNVNLEQQVLERSSQLEGALDEVRDKEQRLRQMSGRALELQEAERRALSRELHDSAGQALTAIRINLQLIAQQAKDAGVQKTAERTVHTADVTLEDIRRVVDRLGPSILDDMGLAAAVQRYCDDFAERTGTLVEHQIDCPEELDSAVETGCYRTVQEALTNVSRHAQASCVDVCLATVGDALELSVVDDGAGFDVEAAFTKGRRGLTGMRERAELLGGSFEVESNPGRGTKLRMRFPLGSRA
jgi:signal transduction histidine kinase